MRPLTIETSYREGSGLIGTQCKTYERLEPFYIEKYVILEKWTPHNLAQNKELYGISNYSYFNTN